MKSILDKPCGPRFLVAALVSVLLPFAGPANGKEAEKGTVELAYVEWDSEVASTNVVRVALEKLGYEVKITPVSAAAMWQAVATGDADGMVSAWLPVTHKHYQEAVGDKVEDLGANLEGTRIGLVVPSYVKVDTIPDLKGKAKQLNRKIIGIDPGAGIMSKTEEVLDEYKLEDYTLVSGSAATMTAMLRNAAKKEQPIVVTGWTPHWMFATWDLKYLDDPKNVYGGKGHIATIVRKGLKEDMPEVYRVLDRFQWKATEMEDLMMKNRKTGKSPYENAKSWVAENPKTVQKWISGTSE